jgi:hypothetical protein
MDLKSGIKTSEFWLGPVLGNVMGLLFAFDIFTPEQVQTVASTGVEQITGVVGHANQVIGGGIAAISNAAYAISRGLAKRAQ